MIYLGIDYLPLSLQNIYIKKYKYLDVILTYATLSKGHPSFAYLDPRLFIEYLSLAIKILNEAEDKKDLIKYYKKKIKNLNMENFIMTPTNSTYYLKTILTNQSNYPPIGPSNYPPDRPPNYPPIGPSNYPPDRPPNYPPDGPSNQKMSIVLRYSLRDRYQHMLWTITNDLLHPYHRNINGLSDNVTEDDITYNDLIKIRNKLSNVKHNDFSDFDVLYNLDTFHKNRLDSIESLIKLVQSMMQSLYKITGKSYENVNVSLKFLLKDALYYQNVEPEYIYK